MCAPPGLLEQLRAAIRARHYSRRTEEAYVLWARRFILFQGKRHPRDMGAPEVSGFLTALAVRDNVSASTQNQALSALLFLYGEVLRQPLPSIDVRERRRQQRQEAIMPRVGLIGAFIVLALGGAVATDASHLRLQAVASWNDYDDFMKLSADQRRARFVAISAENKAMIVQTHAQRWLDNNRGRLTASEVGVFEEIIAFITPDLYRERPDDTLDKREQELRTTMRCRVSPDDVRAATNVFRPEPASPSQKPTWTYLNQSKCWIHWFVEGLVDYIPSQIR